jgi:hypothetical protein
MTAAVKTSQSWITAAALAIVVTTSAMASAEVRPKVVKLDVVPKSVLFIGNSYFYYNASLHHRVRELLRSADPAGKYHALSATISDAALSWHNVEALLSSATLQADGSPGSGPTAGKARVGKFDAVIMMDCSHCATDPKLKANFTATIAKDSAIVRKHAAQPVLFMTWAYADRPDLTEKLADAYTRAGNDNTALVIPAGLAFARARAQRPEVALHVADNSHPSLAGTYLAACVVMASVFRRSPVGNTYHADLDGKTAAFLQEVAWATVQDYYRQ